MLSTRYAVLGGGGFIGTNLCRKLSQAGMSVRAFGRRQTFPEALNGIEWFSGDFNDSLAISAALDGVDVVYHLVNGTTPSSANIDKIADIKANVVSTIHFLDACCAQNVKRVIFASSGGTVYGATSVIPTPEDAPTWPLTSYAISKLAVERYLFLYNHLYGLDYRILRVANPYGPYQTAQKSQGVVAAFLRNAREPREIEIWGDGLVQRDYIFVDDVVDAMIAAASHVGTHKIFNIGSGKSLSLLDLVQVIEGAIGQPVAVNYRSGRLVDAPISRLDISRALEELTWRPKVELEKGIAKTVEWLNYVDAGRSSILGADGSLV